MRVPFLVAGLGFACPDERRGLSRQTEGPVLTNGGACPDERKETRDLRVMSSNPIPVPSDRQTVQLS